jgi:hypothetical protein
MTFKRTTPITALDLDPSDLPDPSSSLKGGVTLAQLRNVAKQAAGTLADVQAISGLKWLFSPDTGFYSDTAGTTLQTTNGGAVKCWKDGSANADHATTASTGLTLAQGIAGGCDGLAIAGSTTRLKTTGTFDSSFNAGMTTFLVAHHPTIAANQVIVSSNDSRWYQAWNGSNQQFGPVMTATSYTQPLLPVDVLTNATSTAPKPGVMVEAFRYNGPSTAMDMFFDGYYVRPAASASATALALTGVLNIGGLPSSFHWGGNIIAFIAFNRALTDAEVQVVYNYLAGVARTNPKPLVKCIGNSLTAGTGASTGVVSYPNTSTNGYAKHGNKDYPSQLLDLYPSDDVLVRQDAYPGRTLTQINSEISRMTMATFDPASHPKRVALVWEVTNELSQNLAANVVSINAGTTPAAYTSLVTACNTLRSQGWVVGVLTCLPRSDNTAANDVLYFRAYQHINQLIRKNWPDFADVLVDVAADPRLGYPGCETNTMYFDADLVHMTNEGYRVVAGIVKRALDPIIGGIAPARTVLSKSVAGGSAVTLTPGEYGTVLLPGGNGIVTLTGVLTADINVIQGKKARAYCDGTNWLQATPEL